MTFILYLCGLVPIAATLVSLSKHPAWWVRACDFPRLQIAAVLATVLAVSLLADDAGAPARLLLSAALLACLVFQLAVVLPYTPLWRAELLGDAAPPGERTFSLLVVNVLMSNRRADTLLELIREQRPDLVLAVEVDGWWCDRLAALADDYPGQLAHPLDNTYGMLLCSRLELIRPELRFLLSPEIPSIRTEVRLRSGATVTLYGLHPEPPAPEEAQTSAPRDAELVMVAREVAESNRSAIVAGDLNDVAWSHTSRLFRRISRLLDPRIGRGMFNSFHARYWPLRWPLDHVFVSDDFVLKSMRRLPKFGSDHFPILITLAHNPQAAPLQEAPEDDSEDRAEARQKLAQSGAGRTAR